MRAFSKGLCSLLLIVMMTGCERPPAMNEGTATEVSDEARTFEVRGEIVEIRDEGRELVIAHEEIPGYMSAMTMPFRLKEPLTENEREVGDDVAFRFVVTGASAWVEDVRPLEVTEDAPLTLSAEPERIAATEASLYQYDVPWTTQYGETVTLGTFQDRPVVLSMVFTNCSYACPMIVSDMKKLAAALPQDQRERVQYLLVSLDPERDTPEALRHFGDAYGLNDAGWTLLRGDADQVRMLAALLGIRYRKQSDGQFAHTSLITLLDHEGEIAHQQQGLGTGNDLAGVLSDLASDATMR